MNILFLSTSPPHPPNDGGRIRTLSLMRRVAKDHSIFLATFLPADGLVDSWTPLREVCSEVHAVPAPAMGRPLPAERLKMMWRRQPFALRQYHSGAMVALLQELVHRQAVDVIHVVDPYMIPYVKEIVGPARVMDHMDVEAAKQRRLLLTDAKRYRPYWWLRWLEHFRWRSFEVTSLAWFDAHCAVCDRDAAYFKQHAPSIPVYVVANGVDTNSIRPRPDPSGEPTLLYVGSMDYQPNVDAVLWFTRRVWPAIRAAVPGVRLIVVGRSPPPEIRALATLPGILVTGTVPDVLPYYERAHALVVSLRSGGGTRLKILEAMAFGVPVVSTSIGAEGLDVTIGADLLRADAPQAFAEQTIRLLNDRDLRIGLSARARQTVEAKYDWRSIGQNLINAYHYAITSH